MGRALSLLFLAWALVPAPALAEPPSGPMRLDYRRDAGAERCPDEQAFRDAVAARSRRAEPFEPQAAARLLVQVHRTGNRYQGTAELQDDAGATTWSTQIGPVPNDCEAIVDSLASAVVVKLRLYLPAAAPPAAPPEPPRATAPAQCIDSRFSVWPTEWPLRPLEKPRLKAPEPPERWPVAVRLGAGAWAEEIATGWESLGLSAEIGVRYRAFSVGVEAHGDPPLGSSLHPLVGPVSFARLSGALLLCAHFGWFVGCGVGDVGRFLFPIHPPMLPAATFYGAAGLRAGLEFPVAPPRLFLRMAADVRAPVHPAGYAIMGSTVFASAGPSVGLGLGLVAELSP